MLLQLRIHEIYVHIIAKENFEIPRCLGERDFPMMQKLTPSFF